MKKLIYLISLCSLFTHFISAQEQSIFPNQIGEELLESLVQEYKTINVLDYGEARDFLYGEVYNENDSVKGIYTNHTIYLPSNVDPSTFLYMNGSNNGINAEHVYPQSKGAGEGNPRSDMHHIFPARTGVNSSRGNLPFGEVPDDETQEWYRHNKMEQEIPIGDIERWSERGRSAFEPREDVKGNVARAVFYFYTMYKAEADKADNLFFDIQRADLCQWHIHDPVDEKEFQRTLDIAIFQDDNPNPFVVDCSLVARTYCGDILTQCQLKTVGISNTVSSSISLEVSPNPSFGQMTLRYIVKEKAKIRLSVYDLFGRELLKIIEESTEGEYSKPLSLEPGIYIVQMVQESSTSIYEGKEKIIVR